MAALRLAGPKLLRQITRQPNPKFTRTLHMSGAERTPRLPTPDKTHLPAATTSFAEPQPNSKHVARHFNTSRSLKQVNDASTIDFAYLPVFPLPHLAHEQETEAPSWQIPILPSATHRYDSSSASLDQLRARRDSATTLPEEKDMAAMPMISMAAGESTHHNTPSALSDVNDGGEHHHTDFHEVAETLASGSAKIGETVDAVRDAARKVALGMEREGQELKQSKGLLKQVWTGLVADIMGEDKAAKA